MNSNQSPSNGALGKVDQGALDSYSAVAAVELASSSADLGSEQVGAPVQWSIDDVLPLAASVSASPDQTGTMVVMALAHELAQGIPGRDGRTDTCETLWVAADGATGFAARMEQPLRKLELALDELPFALVPDAIDLTCAVAGQLVVDAATARPRMPGFIVLDVQNRRMISDKMIAQHVAKVEVAAREISKATGAHILVLGGARTGRTGSRGLQPSQQRHQPKLLN